MGIKLLTLHSRYGTKYLDILTSNQIHITLNSITSDNGSIIIKV